MAENRVGQRCHALRPGHAEQLLHHRPGQTVAAKREQLVEQRLGIAHRTCGTPGDDLQRLVVGLHFLRAHNGAQVRRDALGADQDEIEALAARQNRDRDFLNVRGRENELHVRRRLFQRLQQCVEGRNRQHVNFVDDVYLVMTARRARRNVLPQRPDVVDAVVARAINLAHVEVFALGNGRAAAAHVARRRRRSFGAIQRLGEDARSRSLADTAGAGEQVGVRDPVAGHGVLQRLCHRFLADQLVELLRAVTPGHDGVFGLGLRHAFL